MGILRGRDSSPLLTCPATDLVGKPPLRSCVHPRRFTLARRVCGRSLAAEGPATRLTRANHPRRPHSRQSVKGCAGREFISTLKPITDCGVNKTPLGGA